MGGVAGVTVRADRACCETARSGGIAPAAPGFCGVGLPADRCTGSPAGRCQLVRRIVRSISIRPPPSSSSRRPPPISQPWSAPVRAS
ncbi:hypothetical protein ACFFX0_10295 [Citricoccus parietis]|uniref:Uncharacterized protein n=1 Tax=Citricoccus parietis TaxID=592307 RepID=A0ABV5FY00_9MICC